MEKKYSGVVIGTIVSVCEDEDNEADCSIAIRYEVDGKEYILDIDDDDLIVKNYNEEVRYNPDNPSDAYSNSESVFYTSVEEKAWKYYTERFAKISFAIAVIAVFDAFVGYFIDNLFDQLNKTKEEIVDRTIDNDKKDKS